MSTIAAPKQARRERQRPEFIQAPPKRSVAAASGDQMYRGSRPGFASFDVLAFVRRSYDVRP